MRLCAEEPADDFLPRSGTVLDWHAEERVRCDHAIANAMPVSPWYDSMLAKVIAHGATREEALDRLARALDRTTLLGIATNRAFLARVLRHPVFVDGSAVSTSFIGRHFADAGDRAAPPDGRTWALAAWLSVAAATEGDGTPAGWRNWSTGLPLPRPWRLHWLAPQSLRGLGQDGQHGLVHLSPIGSSVTRGEASARIGSASIPPRTFGQVEIDGDEVTYRYAWDESTLWLQTSGGDHAFRCLRREAARSLGADDASGPEIRAGINGRVLEVVVAEGASVTAGDRLVVLEAMKMEHEIRATRAGRVAAVGVKAGEQVAPGQWLVRLEGEA